MQIWIGRRMIDFIKWVESDKPYGNFGRGIEKL
jgi:hypothetical protein